MWGYVRNCFKIWSQGISEKERESNRLNTKVMKDSIVYEVKEAATSINIKFQDTQE